MFNSVEDLSCPVHVLFIARRKYFRSKCSASICPSKDTLIQCWNYCILYPTTAKILNLEPDDNYSTSENEDCYSANDENETSSTLTETIEPLLKFCDNESPSQSPEISQTSMSLASIDGKNNFEIQTMPSSSSACPSQNEEFKKETLTSVLLPDDIYLNAELPMIMSPFELCENDTSMVYTVKANVYNSVNSPTLEIYDNKGDDPTNRAGQSMSAEDDTRASLMGLTQLKQTRVIPITTTDRTKMEMNYLWIKQCARKFCAIRHFIIRRRHRRFGFRMV